MSNLNCYQNAMVQQQSAAMATIKFGSLIGTGDTGALSSSANNSNYTMSNGYYDMTQLVYASTETAAGAVKSVAPADDDVAWLRARVEEMCWRKAS